MKAIHIIRTLRGMTQWDLSVKTGIRNHRLSHIENGRFEPRPAELKAIAKALGVTVDALTADEGKILEAIGNEAFGKESANG